MTKTLAPSTSLKVITTSYVSEITDISSKIVPILLRNSVIHTTLTSQIKYNATVIDSYTETVTIQPTKVRKRRDATKSGEEAQPFRLLSTAINSDDHQRENSQDNPEDIIKSSMGKLDTLPVINSSPIRNDIKYQTTRTLPSSSDNLDYVIAELKLKKKQKWLLRHMLSGDVEALLDLLPQTTVNKVLAAFTSQNQTLYHTV